MYQSQLNLWTPNYQIHVNICSVTSAQTPNSYLFNSHLPAGGMLFILKSTLWIMKSILAIFQTVLTSEILKLITL